MSTKLFQIASIAQPMEIQWAPSHYDNGKLARAIKCFVDDETLVEELKAIDDTLLKDDDYGRHVLRLKVWQSARVQVHDSDQLLTVDELRNGDRITVMAKPYKWQYEGREGTSLTAGHVLVVQRGSGERKSAAPTWF
jgi:hypothetical protein